MLATAAVVSILGGLGAYAFRRAPKKDQPKQKKPNPDPSKSRVVHYMEPDDSLDPYQVNDWRE
jgi:hypothetical protein